MLPTLIIGTVLITGNFHHFWTSYILIASINPAVALGPMEIVVYLTYLYEFIYYAIGSVGIITVGFWFERRRLTAFNASTLLLVAIFALASFVVIVKPGRFFQHYAMLAVQPLALLTGISLLLMVRSHFQAQESGEHRKVILNLPVRIVALLVISMLPYLINRAVESPNHKHVHKIRIYGQPHKELAVTTIRDLPTSNDGMAVWGWMADLYVQTQKIPGTRDTTTPLQVATDVYSVSPERLEYYQQRFIEDLRASQPALFVDAVCSEGFLLNDRLVHGYESLPELRQLIDNHYELILDTATAGQNDGIRVFLRKTETSIENSEQ